MNKRSDLQVATTKREDTMGSGPGTRGRAGGGGAAALSSEEEKPTAAEGAVGREFTEDELNALSAYQGAGFKDINSLLRGSDVSDPTQASAWAENLDNMMEVSRLDEDMELFRGSAMMYFPDLKIGSVISDKGFLSTSTEERTGIGWAYREDGAILRIKAPKGTKGIDVHKAVGDRSITSQFEREMLLPRDTKLKVTGMTKDTVWWSVEQKSITWIDAIVVK